MQKIIKKVCLRSPFVFCIKRSIALGLLLIAVIYFISSARKDYFCKTDDDGSFAAISGEEKDENYSKTISQQYPIDKKLFRMISPTAINVTGYFDDTHLLHTRVMKSGSTTFLKLLRLLAKKNGFTLVDDPIKTYRSIWLKTYEEQEKLMQNISNLEKNTLYLRHMFYLNFTRHSLRQPLQTSVVRDPIERAASWFYFVRREGMRHALKTLDPERWEGVYVYKNQTFDECILNGDHECRYVEGDDYYKSFLQQTLFFCGNDVECMSFNGIYPLQKAKENVEKHYAVVGVVEDFETTASVFSSYIPLYFSNALDLFLEHYEKIHANINYYTRKPSLSHDVRHILERNFTREIEFYHFCRQRLYMQYCALGL